MKDWKIFIISILIFGTFSACKHEFEEGTHWSWYTKAELINRRGLFLEINKITINGEKPPRDTTRSGCSCQVYVRTLNYSDFSHYNQAANADKSSIRYTRIKDTIELDSPWGSCCPFPLGEWKIVDLTKNVFIVKKIHNGKEYKIWFK